MTDKKFRRTTQFNCVVRFQSDGAPAHKEGTLESDMIAEFSGRGWSWTIQSPQSPMVNTWDASLFPCLSKMVSKQQSILAVAVLIEKEILRLSKKCYEELKPSTIARAFAAHHQVVCAVRQHGGSNGFWRRAAGFTSGSASTTPLSSLAWRAHASTSWSSTTAPRR